MRKEIPFLKMISVSAKIQLKEVKGFFILFGVVGILSGVTIGLITMATVEFFDAVTMAVEGDGSSEYAYRALIILAIVFIVSLQDNRIN